MLGLLGGLLFAGRPSGFFPGIPSLPGENRAEGESYAAAETAAGAEVLR
jgi:hypothetical protein